MTQHNQLSKLTPQHHAFINYLVLENLKASEAYNRAYPESTHESAITSAARLLSQDNIKQEIEALKADLRAKKLEQALNEDKPHQPIFNARKIEELRSELLSDPECPHAVRAKVLDDLHRALPDADLHTGGKVVITWGDDSQAVDAMQDAIDLEE